MIRIAISPPAHMWIFVDISGVIEKIFTIADQLGKVKIK